MGAEWDFRAQDTHLAAAIDAAATSCILGHPRSASGQNYPGNVGTGSIATWATIAPDDPLEREEVLITTLAVSSAAATIVRGLGDSDAVAHRQGTPVRIGTRSGAYPHDPVAPTLLNSWVNVGGSFMHARYWRTPDGLVLLAGWIQSGTGICFTLPAGWRPDQTGLHSWPAIGSGSVLARVNVDPNGDVSPINAPAGGISLDGVAFWAGG